MTSGLGHHLLAQVTWHRQPHMTVCMRVSTPDAQMRHAGLGCVRFIERWPPLWARGKLKRARTGVAAAHSQLHMLVTHTAETTG